MVYNTRQVKERTELVRYNFKVIVKGSEKGVGVIFPRSLFGEVKRTIKIFSSNQEFQNAVSGLDKDCSVEAFVQDNHLYGLRVPDNCRSN